MAGPESSTTQLCDRPPRPVGLPSDKGGSVPLENNNGSTDAEGQGRTFDEGATGASLEAEHHSEVSLDNTYKSAETQVISHMGPCVPADGFAGN